MALPRIKPAWLDGLDRLLYAWFRVTEAVLLGLVLAIVACYLAIFLAEDCCGAEHIDDYGRDRAAFVAAARAADDKTVLLGDGPYDWHGVNVSDVPDGLTVQGNGRTLIRLKPNSSKRAKLLVLTGDATVEGVNFDGQLDRQGVDDPWQKQWQACIAIDDGELVLSHVRFANAANGLLVRDAASVTAHHVTAEKTLRGGIVISGHPGSRGRHSFSACVLDEIRIEPNHDSWGYDVSLGVSIVGRFNLAGVSRDAETKLLVCQIDQTLVNSQGVFLAKHSELGEVRFKHVGEAWLSDCAASSLLVDWRSEGETLTVEHCTFDGDGQGTAVTMAADRLERGNLLSIRGGHIKNYQTAVRLNRGGRLEITDTEVETTEGLNLGWKEDHHYDVTLDGWQPQCSWYWYSRIDHAKNVVTHKNVTLDWTNFATKKGMREGNTYRGSRTLLLSAPPDGSLEALPGDVVAVGQQSWICTRGSYGKRESQWRPVEP